MQNIISDAIKLFKFLQNSPYTPYIVVALFFVILLIIQVRKVRGRNKRKKMFLIETQRQDLPIQIESTSHAMTFEGEVFDLTRMEKRQITEIIWILRFLPLFFLSTLLIVFVSPMLWPISFIGLLGIFFVTILGAARMLKYGNERDYVSGQELLSQLSKRKNFNSKPTVLMNQIKINNFFNYLSCESQLRLNDRVSSTWTLYVGLRAIKELSYTLKDFKFSIDNKGVRIPSSLQKTVSSEDSRKITDFLMVEDDEKVYLSIKSYNNFLIAKIRIAVREPQRVTEALMKRLVQSFEILKETSVEILQSLQT